MLKPVSHPLYDSPIPLHVDTFLGFMRQAKLVLGAMRIDAISISSHEDNPSLLFPNSLGSLYF